MFINQISIFVENKPGGLFEVTDILAQSEIDITALSLADTSDFGILRLIVDKPEVAAAALREAGLIVKQSEVLAVPIEDAPGGLTKVLHTLSEGGVFIEYMYAFAGKMSGKAVVVMRADDAQKASSVLGSFGTNVLSARELYSI